MFPEDQPSAEIGAVYDRLVKSYSEPHRHYHTLDHLYACFRVLDAHFPEASPSVQLALWFHDIVYDTHSGDNEERSGEIAIEELAKIDLDLPDVYDLILATKHHEAQGEEAQTVVDVDLSILGETPSCYERYERDVRQEYHWVPEEVFWAHRRTILKTFMDREWIYFTAPMRQSEYEGRAWANLGSSVAP